MFASFSPRRPVEVSSMNTKAVTTRRRFFWKAGAALSAPLVVATAHPSESSLEDIEALKAQLAKLEDVNAIRELQQTYARCVNARAHEEVARLFADPSNPQVDDSIRSLCADRFGEQDVIEVAAHRGTARARTHWTVEVETPIEPSCPLVEMALQQGDGVLRRTETRVLESTYVKQSGVWKIERSGWHAAGYQ
jgi:hypothetical protein